MMRLRKTLYTVMCLALGLCTLSGCIEEYEADIPAEETNLLVVEGTICSGKLNRFVLTRSQPLKDEPVDGGLPGYWTMEYANYSYAGPQIVWGAKVSVRGTDGSEYVARMESKAYCCQLDSLSPDVAYYLHIETDDEVYETEPQRPLPTEAIDSVYGVQKDRTSNIDILVTPDVPFDSEQANYYSWTYDETWEVHPEYTTDLFFDVKLKTAIRKPGLFPLLGWKTATSSSILIGASQRYEDQHIQGFKLYDIGLADERLYYKYSGMIRQRAITKAEYEYEVIRRQAGSEMGGLFTPLPSALPTNIRCLTSDKRAIGYVGCSLNTSERRFFIHAGDFFVRRPAAKDDLTWLYGCTEDDCCAMVASGYYLCEWLDNRLMPGGRLSTSWAHKYQLDVREQGAFTTEPDFWRDDEEKDEDEDEDDEETEAEDEAELLENE